MFTTVFEAVCFSGCEIKIGGMLMSDQKNKNEVWLLDRLPFLAYINPV